MCEIVDCINVGKSNSLFQSCESKSSTKNAVGAVKTVSKLKKLINKKMVIGKEKNVALNFIIPTPAFALPMECHPGTWVTLVAQTALAILPEASSHDQINMTEFRLEHDQKFFTRRNLNN